MTLTSDHESAVIRLVDIRKYYQTGPVTVKALDGVNVEVQTGELLAIIGPSGSGKSTMMNVLGCLDVPTGGEYYLDGREISKFDEDELADIRNKKIGFIFQNFNLLSRLTALENVELPLIYRGIGAAERRERATKALDMVGLQDRIQHTPTELSGGQQQRVAIARALAGDPPVILADEPTGNLDSKSGKEVMEILKDLHNGGKTVIIITHDLAVAAQAERVIKMHDGRVIDDEGVA
ncbi:MAG: ABC transporter ATP-binding protein [Thermincola sp.]|jgi:putative ABC transport system ATP-binding protein|nr:ABC transporter ATP-binding protein [Thermincola sp.]MDT3702366.1 ABC transporter ATP-binding protein [Thermincola sp.]